MNKKMTSLVDFFEEIDMEKESDIRKYLKKRLSYTEEKLPPTKDSLYRVSGINQMCPREECLANRHSVTRQKEITHSLASTFAFGRAFEKMHRDEKLGDLGIVLGKWRCLTCGDIPEEIDGRRRYKKPYKCLKCGGTTEGFSYIEEDIINKELLISGHPDGFVVWNKEYYVLEMKTCSAWAFKKCRYTPEPNHVAQVMLYMYFTNYKKGMIWYFNKDTSEDAVHIVDLNKSVVDYLLSKTQAIKEYYERGWLPKRVCQDETEERAKKCDLREYCFADREVVLEPFEKQEQS